MRRPSSGLLLVVATCAVIGCGIWAVVLLLRGSGVADSAAVVGVLVALVALLTTLRYRMQDRLEPTDANLERVKALLRDRLLSGQDEVRARLVDKTRLFGTEVELVETPGRRLDDVPIIAGIAEMGRLLDSVPHHRLLILGDRGSGKSILALALADQILQDATIGIRAVPVMLNVSRWRAGTPLDSWMVDELGQEFQLATSLAEGLVRRREIIPVLDGLDELGAAPAGDRHTRARELIGYLNAYTRGGRPSPLVVTCRTDYYEGLAADGPASPLDATAYRVLPLTEGGVRDYLRGGLDAAIWQPVIAALDNSTAPLLASRFRQPLWLSLAIAGVSKRVVEPRSLLAQEIGHEFEESLMDAHLTDLLTSMRFRAVLRASRPDDLRRWFVGLAVYLTRNEAQVAVGDRILSPSGLVPHELWPFGGIRRVRNVDFALSLAVSAPGLAWLGDLLLPRSSWYLVLLLPFYAVYTAALVRTSRKYWIAPKFFVVRQLFGRSAVAQFGLAALGGVVATRIFDGVVGVVVAVSVWIMSGLSIGISQTLVMPPRRSSGPDAPLLGERSISFVAAAAGAPALGLIAWRTSGQVGLVLALIYALLVGLTVASAPWRRYVSFLLCRGRRAPLRTLALLRAGHRHGLLRVSGLEYQFRHVEFQHRLAALEGSTPRQLPT